MFDQIFDEVSEAARNIMVGRLNHSLKAELGFGPFAFETDVAAHLLKRDFVIYAHDLEAGGGFDFLAQRGETEVEIECKYISADIGRQIHRNRFCQLAERLQPLLSHPKGRTGILLPIQIPGRLNGALSQHNAILANVKQTLSTGASTVSQDCTVALERFDIDSSPFAQGRPPDDQMEEFFETRFRLSGGHAIASGSSDGVCTAYLWSRAPDRMLGQLVQKTKADAKAQFTKRRPAILCLYFADLSEEELLDIAQDEKRGIVTGIRQAISALINRRPHLHTVALMVKGRVEISRQRSGAKKTTEVAGYGTTYSFPNTDHPDADNRVLRALFGG